MEQRKQRSKSKSKPKHHHTHRKSKPTTKRRHQTSRARRHPSKKRHSRTSSSSSSDMKLGPIANNISEKSSAGSDNDSNTNSNSKQSSQGANTNPSQSANPTQDKDKDKKGSDSDDDDDGKDPNQKKIDDLQKQLDQQKTKSKDQTHQKYIAILMILLLFVVVIIVIANGGGGGGSVEDEKYKNSKQALFDLMSDAEKEALLEEEMKTMPFFQKPASTAVKWIAAVLTIIATWIVFFQESKHVSSGKGTTGRELGGNVATGLVSSFARRLA